MLVDFNWKGENCRGTDLWNLTQTNCGKLHNNWKVKARIGESQGTFYRRANDLVGVNPLVVASEQ